MRKEIFLMINLVIISWSWIWVGFADINASSFHKFSGKFQVNIGIWNTGYLKHSAYVEIGRRLRPFSLYIWFRKLISRIQSSRIPSLYRSILTTPITYFTWVISRWIQFSSLLMTPACRFLIIPARGNSHFFSRLIVDKLQA